MQLLSVTSGLDLPDEYMRKSYSIEWQLIQLARMVTPRVDLPMERTTPEDP